MFGFSGFHRYKNTPKDAPARNVTTAEFVAALVAQGESEEEANMQAKVNKMLGAFTLVGNEKLHIVE